MSTDVIIFSGPDLHTIVMIDLNFFGSSKQKLHNCLETDKNKYSLWQLCLSLHTIHEKKCIWDLCLGKCYSTNNIVVFVNVCCKSAGMECLLICCRTNSLESIFVTVCLIVLLSTTGTQYISTARSTHLLSVTCVSSPAVMFCIYTPAPHSSSCQIAHLCPEICSSLYSEIILSSLVSLKFCVL